MHALAGPLIKRFGPKVLLTGGFTVASVLTILTYQMAQLGDWRLTCAGRVMQGLSQGFIYPGCHVLISKWVPPEERAKLSSVIYSGDYECW